MMDRTAVPFGECSRPQNVEADRPEILRFPGVWDIKGALILNEEHLRHRDRKGLVPVASIRGQRGLRYDSLS